MSFIVRRSSIARRWIQRKASFSFMSSSSINIPLARSTSLRVASRCSRSLFSSSSAFISSKRPMASSMAGTRSLR